MSVIGEAFVKVSPDLTGFSAKLKAELKTALPGGVPIRLVPELVGFRAKLAAELKALSGAPVKITPDVAGFRTKLEAELATLGAVPILVTPVIAPGSKPLAETAARGAAGASASVEGATAAHKALAAAVKLSEEALLAHTKALEGENAALLETAASLKIKTAALIASVESEVAAVDAAIKATSTSGLKNEFFVKVSPLLTGFRTALLTKIKELLPDGVPIRLTPELIGFRQKLQAEFRTLTGTEVPINPDLTGFRTKLTAELEALGGVPVLVTPVLAPGAKLVAETVTAAIPTATATPVATTAITGIEKQRASTSSLLSIQARAEVLQERLNRLSQVSAGVTLDQAAAVKNLAEAIRISDAAIALNVRGQASLNEATAASTAQLRAAAAEAVGDAEKQKAASLAATKAATEAGGAKTAQAAGDKAIASAGSAAAAQANRLTVFQNAETAGSKRLADIKARLAEINKILAVSERQLSANSETTNASLLKLLQSNVDLAKTEQAAATGALKQAEALAIQEKETLKLASTQVKAAAAQDAQIKTAFRGTAATGLAAAGLRGATLAASAPFLIGAAVATIIVKATSAAASFQKQLILLQDVSGATTEEMKRLSQAAINLGSDLSLPGVSANDAAKALTNLVTAGFSVRESLQAVRASLLLSVAAQLDVNTATEVVSRTLDTFGLKSDQATRVVNDLVNAATHAEGTVTDFAAGLQQVGVIAARGGISLKNTTALLIELARGGFTGAAAGTALRQALIRLENPTRTTAAVLKDLNVNLRDQQGNIRPDFLVILAKATDGFNKSLRDTIIAGALGARAVRAFDIAARGGPEALRNAAKVLDDQSAAQRRAAAQTEGLSGHVKELGKNATTLGVQFGSGLTPAFIQLTDTAGKTLRGFSQVGKVIADVASVTRPLRGSFSAISSAIGSGIAPVLAVVAAFKAYGAITSVVTAVQNRYIGTTAVLARADARLTAAQAEVAATAEAAAAAEGTLASSEARAAAAAALESQAQAEASVAQAEKAAAAAGAGSVAAAGGFRALLGPIGLGITAAIGLGVVLQILGHRESDTKKATDELAESARRLGTAFNATNIILERKAIEDLAKAQKDAATGNDRIITPVSAGRGISIQIRPGNEQKIATDAAAGFVKNLRAQANAVRDFNPLLAHNRDLLADFVKAIGRVPTKKEIKVVASNKETKTSFDEILRLIRDLGERGREDAATAGSKINAGLIAGVSHGGKPEITQALSDTLSGLKKQLSPLLAISNEKGPAGEQAVSFAKDIVAKIAAFGPRGKALLKQFGKQLGDGITAGLTSTEKDQIAAANQAVADAIRQGQQQIQSAISSAKTNLGSISQTLAGEVGQVLDARATAAIAALDHSQLGREITTLTGELNKSQFKQQKAQLQFNIATATDDSSRRNAVFALQQFEIQHRLDTDKKLLDTRKTAIQKTSDLQKAAVQRDFAAFADEFAQGKITLAKFTQDVLDDLRKHHVNFQNAGKDLGGALGEAFFSAAQADLKAFLEQAAALIGFTGGTGTNQTNVTKPGDVAAQVALDVRNAKKTRDDTLKAIKGKSNKGTNDILQEILDYLDGKKVPKNTTPKTTKTTGTGKSTQTANTSRTLGHHQR